MRLGPRVADVYLLNAEIVTKERLQRPHRHGLPSCYPTRSSLAA